MDKWAVKIWYDFSRREGMPDVRDGLSHDERMGADAATESMVATADAATGRRKRPGAPERAGVAVPGATATVTAAAVGEAVTLPITAMVRQFGNCAGATYTVVLSGAATVSNIAVTVDKI